MVDIWYLTELQSDRHSVHFSGLVCSISFMNMLVSQGSQAIMSVLLNLGRYQGKQLNILNVVLMKHSRMQLL